MRSPDIKLSARSWSVCPPTSIPLVSASVAPHAKSLQCHELTERALHEERGNAFYPRLAIAASPLADGKHPRKNWPRRTSFSRIYRSRKLSLASITKKSWLAPNPPCKKNEFCRGPVAIFQTVLISDKFFQSLKLGSRAPFLVVRRQRTLPTCAEELPDPPHLDPCLKGAQGQKSAAPVGRSRAESAR